VLFCPYPPTYDLRDRGIIGVQPPAALNKTLSMLLQLPVLQARLDASRLDANISVAYHHKVYFSLPQKSKKRSRQLVTATAFIVVTHQFRLRGS
jgi:hypothetical protein